LYSLLFVFFLFCDLFVLVISFFFISPHSPPPFFLFSFSIPLFLFHSSFRFRVVVLSAGTSTTCRRSGMPRVSSKSSPGRTGTHSKPPGP
jgi:hypothetical protein